MLLPVADMYYVKSTALMTIISMLVGAQLVTCILILPQHANQILYTLWKEMKKKLCNFSKIILIIVSSHRVLSEMLRAGLQVNLFCN